jgi:hypothetical protein
MATPTIIIGLGTSGLRVIENVQKYYYENFKTNKPSFVEYLYLETADSEYPMETPAGNDIQRAYISLDNMANMIAGVEKRCDNPQWLPESNTVLTAGLGAGGIRSCGRLALWGTNDNGDNFDTVIRCIQSAYTNVMHVNNNESSSNLTKPTVFVTGSLTGGTGSGVFIDFGYLIRHIIKDVKDLYGLFLLPNSPRVMHKYETMYGNTYGAIYDLGYYNKEGNKYVEKWPTGEKKEFDMPPYELVQYISQDYKDGSPAIGNLGGLYKMAGLYLFLNIAGIYDKRKVRLVDAMANGAIGKYGTFGLSAIQFPKDSIQDFIASTLSINLLKRLTDSKEYYRKGDQKYPINRGNIKNQIPKKMDEILLNAFANLNTGYERDLQIEMRKEVEKIGRDDITGDKIEYIISLFSSNSDDKFYSRVSGNTQSAQKIIVDGIYEMVDKALQNSENLYYTKFVLEDIVDYIDRLLNYWKSIGLSSYANKWDDKLRIEAQNCVKNTYKIVGEQDNVLFDRFQNILELMKMHLSIAKLVSIKSHIKEGEIRIEGNENELPKIKFFNDLIDKLMKVIGSIDNDDSEASIYNFERRIKNILGEINDLTLPVLRVYPSNNFDKECEKGIAVYENKNGRVRSLIRLKDVADFNLLNYFKARQSGKFYREIYIDLLNDFRKKTDSSNCVEDYDILTFIDTKTLNRTQCINTANRSASPFISVKGDLPPSPYLPQFIVCNNTHKITAIIKHFGNELKFNDNPNEKLELTELKNIIVFYCEKPIHNPIEDITYIKRMKETYEQRPLDSAIPDETDATWNRKRRAYLTPDIGSYDANGKYVPVK